MIIISCPQCNLQHDVTNFAPGTTIRCRCGNQVDVPDDAVEAGSMSCPNCGSNIKAHDTKCAACGSVLATVTCPQCFNRLRRGARFCDICGAEITASHVHASSGKKKKCPRCGQMMEEKVVADNALDECQACGGLWMNNEIFKRLVSEQQREGHSAFKDIRDQYREKVDAYSSPDLKQVVYLKCPECDKLMNRINFAKRSGVIVDECRPHGTWFDRDELRKILDWVASGHYDKAIKETEQQEKKRLKQIQKRMDQYTTVTPSFSRDRSRDVKPDMLAETFIRAIGSFFSK